MFTCIFPSPLKSLLPASCLQPLTGSGKEEQTSYPCESFWKSPRQCWPLAPLSWAPRISSVPLYLRPMPALPSYSCARLFLFGGTDPVAPTRQAMEDLLGHGSFGTFFFPAPRRPRLGSYKRPWSRPFPGTTPDVLHLHRPLRLWQPHHRV